MGRSPVSEGRLSSYLRLPALRPVVGFCCFEAAYYFAYWWALAFDRTFGTPVWFPDTVLLCALLLNQPRHWWVYIIGTLPIRLFGPVEHDPAWFLVAAFGLDSAKGILVAIALRRFIKHPPRLESPREFGIFCLFAVLLVPAVVAFGGASLNHLRGHSYWKTWQEWFHADALTHGVVTPAILYWLSALRQGIKMPSVARGLERAIVAAGLIWSVQLTFGVDMSEKDFPSSYFYVRLPFVLWAVIRFGMEGASGTAAALTIFSFKAAIDGQGPFYGKSPAAAAAILQEFLLFRLVPLYLLGILMEQRDRTEHSLRESEQRFRVLADTVPVLIWMSGTDKLCNFVNRGWLKFTGRTLEQELGSGWAEGVHPEDLQRCLNVFNTAFDAQLPFEIEYRLRRHDGEYRWILDQGVPRYATDGDFLGYIGSAIDLTDRKRGEEAREDLVHASRLAVMGELTAMIAHELNQPLNAILTNVDAARILLDMQAGPPTELREVLDDIRKDDLRASEAIRRIRALVSKRVMEMQLMDMNATVSEIVRLARGDALRRGVQIHSDCHASLPEVRGDVVHLQQVVLNLIVNGMDAMKENPEPERHLFVSTDSTPGFVEVAVRDMGHGIKTENLSRIFDSFFTTKPGGMGIGLSMARSIVQLHSGRLWAENNEDGRGTTFLFVLPAAATASHGSPAAANGDESRAGKAVVSEAR